MLDPNWITGLSRPKNMAWDLDGNLFVAQRAISTVTKYDHRGRSLPFTLSGIPLDGPFGIAFDGAATMYVSSANPTANRIDAIALQGEQGIVSAFASGMANPGGVAFQGSLTPAPLG